MYLVVHYANVACAIGNGTRVYVYVHIVVHYTNVSGSIGTLELWAHTCNMFVVEMLSVCATSGVGKQCNDWLLYDGSFTCPSMKVSLYSYHTHSSVVLSVGMSWRSHLLQTSLT